MQKEKERNEVLKHKDDKLNQFREKLDEGTTTDKIKQMKRYLEVVKERLEVKEKKVKDQKEVVKEAIKQFDLAKMEMIKKRKDLEKLEIHKKQWEKEMRFLIEKETAKEHDELGSARHSMQKKEKKRKKSNQSL